MSSTDPSDWHTANQGKAQAAFDRGKAAQQPLDKPRPQERHEKPIAANQPSLDYKPKGPMRGQADRQAHNERLAQEKSVYEKRLQRAKDKNQGAKIRTGQQKQVELNRGKDKDKDGRDR